jgi:toxin ParE1/3/4
MSRRFILTPEANEDLIDQRYRFWRVWSYLIVYRWQSSPIEIIAVVHGARDLDAFFGGRGPTT